MTDRQCRGKMKTKDKRKHLSLQKHMQNTRDLANTNCTKTKNELRLFWRILCFRSVSGIRYHHYIKIKSQVIIVDKT